MTITVTGEELVANGIVKVPSEEMVPEERVRIIEEHLEVAEDVLVVREVNAHSHFLFFYKFLSYRRMTMLLRKREQRSSCSPYRQQCRQRQRSG